MSATGISLDVALELRAICGDEHVTESAAADEKSNPALTVSPASPDEVVAIVRLANKRGFDVVPVGGKTELREPRGMVKLQTDRLTEVEHYDHADLTVGIGAGTPVAQLGAIVGADNLMFGCDPPLPERATVGGVLAAAKHGPMRHGYGSVRDFCIGVRFVTGDGRKAKGGGRVVKNVAGYDMMKLLIGSYGTLGVITSASFKLFPAPRKTLTFLAEFGTWQEALKFRDLVMGSPLSPMCLELVSPQARQLMRPDMTDDAWIICIRAAGSDAVLARYRKELGSAVTREVEGSNETELWHAIENFPARDANKIPRDVMDVIAPPSEMARIIAAADSLHRPKESGVSCGFIGRIGIGHLRLYSWALPDAFYSPKEFFEKLPNLAQVNTVMKTSAPNPWTIKPANLEQMRAVKQALDPNNVLHGREVF